MKKRITTFIFQNWQNSLWKLGWDWRRALSPGFSIFGVDFFRAKHFSSPQSNRVLSHILKYEFNTVLDVGAGSLGHSRMFHHAGKVVTALDLGSSVYFNKNRNSSKDTFEILVEDFTFFESSRKWDLIWASHILEHQTNVGSFLTKIISFCSEAGYICITVPIPHRNLWSGHLSLWTPGLLVYNLVLCGVDASKAEVIFGNGEFSIILLLKKVTLPSNLVFDQGDLGKLKHLLPYWVYENSDPWDCPA